MLGDELIRVLLIEDDERLARLTATYLQTHQVVVTHRADGKAGQAEALANAYDVVLLDLMLPGKSGLEVCRELRNHSDVPIIMVTARGEESEKIVGLEFGADDYVSKPFSSPELLARIRALVRRARGKAGPQRDKIEVGALRLDPGAMRGTLGTKELELTSYEFHVLFALAKRAGRILSREQLLDLAKGSAEEAFDRSIDVHIHRIRKKLGDDSRKPTLLRTVRGMGYMYSDHQG